MKSLGTILRWRLRFFLRRAHRWFPKRSLPTTPARILCIVEGGLGDQLMALPALRALKQANPSAHFFVIWTDGGLAFLDEFHGSIECGKKAWLSTCMKALQGWDSTFVTVQGVFSVFCELLSVLSRAPQTIGPAFSDQLRQVIYTHPYRYELDEHVTVTNLKATGESTTERSIPYPVVFPSEHTRSSVKRTRFLVHPGVRVGYESKQWPLERFRKLAELLTTSQQREVVMTAGPRDLPAVHHIGEGMNVPTIVPESTEELFQTILQADVFVGNDSGPSHAAAALGIPLVVLFGPTNPHRVSPVFRSGILLKPRSASCAPCFDRSGQFCADPLCLSEITVQEVYSACLQLEKAAKRASGAQ